MKSQTSDICHCFICNKTVKKRGLSKHIINSHKISPKEYYDKFLKKPGEGICPVTGKPTRFINLIKGYCTYARNGVANRSAKIKQKRKQTCLKKYGVENPSQSEEVKEKKRQTYLKHYGVENPSQAEEIKQKKKETCLSRYGVESPFQNPQTKDKIKQTWLKKYGVENPLQSEVVKAKTKKTCLEKYGVECSLQSKEVRKKIKRTCLEKFGVENPSQSEEIKKKKKQTYLKHYGVKHPSQSSIVKMKMQQTCLKRYGVENPSQLEEVRQKAKETCLEKYGVEYATQLPEIRRRLSEKYNASFLKKLSKYLQELDLELVDDQYQHAHYKHHWRCLKCGHEFAQIWNAIQQGYTCPVCNPRHCIVSKPESELAEFVKSLGYIISTNDRNLIKPLELDIVVPQKKLAIEYDGLYWHSEQYHDKNYHLQKTEACEKIGYRLIHIFEDEWVFKKDIVKSRLKHILGKTEDLTHIGARECIIKEISSQEKNTFLEQFHIQGKDVSKVRLGAFYQDQLVAVMTFSHGSLAKGVKHQDSLIWELNRFCIHPDFVISGVASKLLEHFKKNYKWKEIYSYADRRWSDGNLYKQLGFELEHTTEPNYWYVRDFERIHRFNLRKRPDEPKDIPEHILRLKEGYVRVWDCGNLKFILTHQQSS